MLVGLAACGDDGSEKGSADEAAAPVIRPDCPEETTQGMKLSVKLRTAAAPRAGNDITWQLIVTNDGETGTVVSPSAQPGDVVLMQHGEEVYRWSREKMFSQAIQCFELRSGRSARLDLPPDRLDIGAGEYEVTASVASVPPPPPYRGTLTVMPQ